MSLSENIKYTLGCLDFQYNQANASSIYFISDLEDGIILHPKVMLDLDRAKLFNADAVYFRFFDANRLPQPQIYIYDNTTRSKDPAYYANIHRNIWSASEIPVFIVVEHSSVKIYDSRKPADVKANNTLSSEPVASIDIDNLFEYDKIIREYHAKQFDSGCFWESGEADKHFLNNKTAYEKLISGLKSVRKSLQIQSNLSSELSDHLLILSILVKYLEENGVDDNGENLAQKFFLEATGHSTLIQIIRNKKIIDLFDTLTTHFNGGIFQLLPSQKEELKSANFNSLACFLEGTMTDQNQMVLWAEYSFKYIPIELISNFYEEFLHKEKVKKSEKEKKSDTGTFYTPGFLVNFLIDECLPLTENNLDENVKLIDISCGSGIFLVTSFKRLVQRWRLANKTDGKLASTRPDVLQNILRNNIFGVDIDKNATELTIFSLNLSLCSMLTPKQIWTELRFDDLKECGNLVHKDFFDYLIEDKPGGFDLVIGNPPIKGLKDKEYKKYEQKLGRNDRPFLCKIPDHQIALMFLDKAMTLLSPNAMLCLILPSGPLLYNNTLVFRNYFFKKYNIPQIIDFTYLRTTLFERANVSVVAIFVQNKLPDESDVLHVTIKRTKASKEKNYFEIDHYDFHDVPKQIAQTVDFVWKNNLVGGGRLYHLINKFRNGSYDTLRDFLQRKKEQNQWEFGQGYKVGNRKNLDKENIITNKRSVIDKFFNEEKGIKKTEIQLETHFETIPKSKCIFEEPHLLIKKTIGKKSIPFEIRHDYLTFKNEILGIHCPETEIKELEKLADILKINNQFFRFYITATSARFGVGRTPYTILLEDIEDLPMLEEKVMLSNAEKILIDDIVEYGINQFAFGENAKVNMKASITDLYSFSDIYMMALNSIYQEDNVQYRLSKVYEGNAFFACEYRFTDEISIPQILSTEADFSNLIDQWSSRSALIKRVLRIYCDKKILLIKPKQLCYWLKSIALRDVDETLNEAFDFNV